MFKSVYKIIKEIQYRTLTSEYQSLYSDIEDLTVNLAVCVKDSTNVAELSAFKSLAEHEVRG